MNIIFAGTSEFGIPSLEKLINKHRLLFVITNPDRPAGRDHKISFSPIKQWAQANQVPIFQPEKISGIEDEIKKAHPDLLLVASYGQIIPQNILKIPKLGSVNIHASLLPKYRGASPIRAAILNNEKKTGVSLILMDEKMDHGPIVATKQTEINKDEDYTQLSTKLTVLAAELCDEALSKFMAGQIKPISQNHKFATFTKLIKTSDARINWGKPSEEIARGIRAFSQSPGAWTTLDGKIVKIYEAEPFMPTPILLPGKIFKHKNGLAVKALDAGLQIKTIQPAGGRKMSGIDFTNGIKDVAKKYFI
jgi:methionyl-tRNA formyltransferase